MRTVSILMLTVAALFIPVYAQADALDDAHRAFAEGRYHDSTLGYEGVMAQHGYSAPILFDLGNSFYREGNFAQAILAYKRAQWLSPGDADIVANLQLAEKQAGLPASAPSFGERLSGLLSASGWAWLACAAWTLLCACLLLRSMVPQWRFVFFNACLASVLVLGAAVAAMIISSKELDQAVVIDKHAAALISPFSAAQPVFSPPPGQTLTVLKTYHDFFLITDQAGHSGWISKTQLTPLIPPQSNG